MRLERKKDEEIAQRQGMTKKTLIQIVWLVISGIVAYFLINFLLESEEINFSYNTLYTQLFIPRAVPEWALLAGMIIVFVLVMQIFLVLGFVIASPEGRRKSGQPTLRSRNKDPFDDRGY